MEPFECEHKTPVSQGLGGGVRKNQACGLTTRMPECPRGQAGGMDLGGGVSSVGLGAARMAPSGGRAASPPFTQGGVLELAWSLRSSACSLQPQAVLVFKSCPR